MKTISTAAVVALMTASVGLGALAPVQAQDAPPPATQTEPGTQPPAPAPAGRDGRPGQLMRHGGGMGALLDIDRGAEAVEIALVRLSHAIDLTDVQKTLLDTLKTDALSAIAEFETATEGLRPAAPAEGETAQAPDISERFNNRITLEKARLAALEAVQPSFTAFFDSLTEEQRTSLMPQPGERMGGMGKFGNHAGPRHNGSERPMGPGNR